MPTVMSYPTTEIGSETEFETILEFGDRSLIVDRERLRIGSSPVCEIRLSRGPLLHSVLCSEAGVVWIELDDETAELTVNDQPCRRMALRDGDVVSMTDGDMVSMTGVTFTIRHQTASSLEEDAAALADDLSHLTADELCDRILSEQSMVDEFDANRRQGWQDLMAAMHGAVLESADSPLEAETDDAVTVVKVGVPRTIEDLDHPDATAECERLLEQIHEIAAVMNGRTRELDVCEDELAAATSLLQETQVRVSQQIQELLDQISDAEPRELRVSA